MSLPKWAKEEENKIINSYFALPNPEAIDPEDYLKEHASNELLEELDKYNRICEEARERGEIIN